MFSSILLTRFYIYIAINCMSMEYVDDYHFACPICMRNQIGSP